MIKKEKSEDFYFPSPIGLLKISIRGETLISVTKSKSYRNKTKKQKLSPLAKAIQFQFQSYFSGNLRQFNIPLLLEGTDAQKKAWRELQKIPYGKTVTYGELALKVNLPKGARFIGQCCAKNPCLIIVPCHRVLSQKGLGGFALGLKVKKTLLSLENNYEKF